MRACKDGILDTGETMTEAVLDIPTVLEQEEMREMTPPTQDGSHIKSTIEQIPLALSGSRQTLWGKKVPTASNDPLDLFEVRAEL